jgi:hypothetical protein
MSLRDLRHNIVNEVDINNLLRNFTVRELSLIFGVTEDYIYKTQNLQRIKAEANINNNIYNHSDEMKLGRKGSWKNSNERKYIQQAKNENNEG